MKKFAILPILVGIFLVAATSASANVAVVNNGASANASSGYNYQGNRVTVKHAGVEGDIDVGGSNNQTTGDANANATAIVNVNNTTGCGSCEKCSECNKCKKEVLNLYPKDSNWQIIKNGTSGKLTYKPCGKKFDYSFKGTNLVSGINYTLIYYPDPWPGNNLICLGSGTANPSGKVSFGQAVDTGDLPKAGDANYSTGAKIWLVTSSDVKCASPSQMTGWHPANYLFEEKLITFDDTDS